jgi:hypothetical protein
MSTILKTSANGFTTTLTARDQYNDYSVVYDYFVTVTSTDGKSRQWSVGTNKARATQLYMHCYGWTSKQIKIAA